VNAAQFAKWSVVSLIAAGLLIGNALSLAKPREKYTGGQIIGATLGVLLRAWMIIAICVWWQP
jgi:hypothetical protein